MLGAQLLDRHTRQDPLRFFVVFSSISSVFGGTFQANYAAANSYLEALVRHRRRINLPGICLQLGAISDIGVVSRDKILLMKMSGNAPVLMVTPYQIMAALFSVLASEGCSNGESQLWLPGAAKQSTVMHLREASEPGMVYSNEHVLLCAALNWKAFSQMFVQHAKSHKFVNLVRDAKSGKGPMMLGGGSEVGDELWEAIKRN